MGPILSALGLMAVVLGVLLGAYVFTRWAGKNLGNGWIGGPGGTGRIRVLDRTGVGKDQSILVIRAGERYLLLGSTPAGITLLTELTREEGESWSTSGSPGASQQPGTSDFRALFQRLREKK